METKTLQEQIDKFYKETRYRLKVKDGKPYYGGSLFLAREIFTDLPDNLVVSGNLDLSCTNITKLPDNLIVGGWLNLRNAEIVELPENLVVGGSLDLYNAKIAKLPDNLVVGGSLYLGESKVTQLPDNLIVGVNLDLYGTKITKLPDNLVVGGSLDLYGTKITKLPDNFVVGGNLGIYGTKMTKLPKNLIVGEILDLDYTKITELPENLVVGGSLYLGYTNVTKLPETLIVGNTLDIRRTKIAELPDDLAVGGSLHLTGSKVTELPDDLLVGGNIFDISSTPITLTLSKEAKKILQKINSSIQNIKSFLQWEQGGTTYIGVDGIFSVVDTHRGNVWVTHQIGKDEVLYVVTDGESHYAHGKTLKEAKADLIYKINDRDTSLYENLSLDDEVSFEEAVAMYRTITGACAAGTRDFVASKLPKPHKERYTIKEIIELTDGEYGSEKLKMFFNASNC